MTNGDGTDLISLDSWLSPYWQALRDRYGRYQGKLSDIEKAVGSLLSMSEGYKYFGFNRGEKKGLPGVWYREWAPEAKALFLTGDFNNWNRYKHPMKKDEFGVFSIFLPDSEYSQSLIHGSKVKVHVVSKKHTLDRIPAYIQAVTQDEKTKDTAGIFWMPPLPYRWKHERPTDIKALRIYEAHVGMAQEKEGIGTFSEFLKNVLPRIKKLGYNAIQLMAIAEHPYYGSFGYQVSNFFSVSHYFGNPDDLKELIDTAHGMGIIVLMDLVHSHSVKNLNEGLNEFDGSDYQYFHPGDRGYHKAWDTKLFNYSKFEVVRYLLSNINYFMNELGFDGFRFDGVTSMLYLDHGLGRSFDHYDRYFEEVNVDYDAVTYFQLANNLIHEINPNAISIAEDVSGMPGLCRPVSEGGLGFDYRLAMGVPDYWIKILKHKKDDDWSMEELFNTLRNRRQGEKHIGYVESHDQALVGDKTVAFWLMDQSMYWNMAKEKQDLVIDRGIALHKMLRLVTFGLAGEGYLNFIGNEFGHPEWIDFPREGNNWSYKYARRQWSLVDNKELRYHFLNDFDKAMQKLDEKYNLLADSFIAPLLFHEERKLLTFRRGSLVFVFNFHPSNSYSDLVIGVPDFFDYELVLSSDDKELGGFDRVKTGQKYIKNSFGADNQPHSVTMYVPSRTGQVMRPLGMGERSEE